jgi:hypothetical protein
MNECKCTKTSGMHAYTHGERKNFNPRGRTLETIRQQRKTMQDNASKGVGGACTERQAMYLGRHRSLELVPSFFFLVLGRLDSFQRLGDALFCSYLPNPPPGVWGVWVLLARYLHSLIGNLVHFASLAHFQLLWSPSQAPSLTLPKFED